MKAITLSLAAAWLALAPVPARADLKPVPLDVVMAGGDLFFVLEQPAEIESVSVTLQLPPGEVLAEARKKNGKRNLTLWIAEPPPEKGREEAGISQAGADTLRPQDPGPRHHGGSRQAAAQRQVQGPRRDLRQGVRQRDLLHRRGGKGGDAGPHLQPPARQDLLRFEGQGRQQDSGRGPEKVARPGRKKRTPGRPGVIFCALPAG